MAKASIKITKNGILFSFELQKWQLQSSRPSLFYISEISEGKTTCLATILLSK